MLIYGGKYLNYDHWKQKIIIIIIKWWLTLFSIKVASNAAMKFIRGSIIVIGHKLSFLSFSYKNILSVDYKLYNKKFVNQVLPSEIALSSVGVLRTNIKNSNFCLEAISWLIFCYFN